MDNNLLEAIAVRLGVVCLSDLKLATKRELRLAVKRMDLRVYSESEWSYGLSYILGKDIRIKNYDDIKRVLVK